MLEYSLVKKILFYHQVNWVIKRINLMVLGTKTKAFQCKVVSKVVINTIEYDTSIRVVFEQL